MRTMTYVMAAVIGVSAAMPAFAEVTNIHVGSGAPAASEITAKGAHGQTKKVGHAMKAHKSAKKHAKKAK